MRPFFRELRSRQIPIAAQPANPIARQSDVEDVETNVTALSSALTALADATQGGFVALDARLDADEIAIAGAQADADQALADASAAQSDATSVESDLAALDASLGALAFRDDVDPSSADLNYGGNPDRVAGSDGDGNPTLYRIGTGSGQIAPGDHTH